MQHINNLISMFTGNIWVEFIAILVIFLAIIICLNVFLKYLQSHMKNQFLAKILVIIRRPILLTLALLGILFYIDTSGVAGDNFYLVARTFNTILYVYYLSLAVKINNMIVLPIIKKKLSEKDVDRDVVILIDKVISALIIFFGIYLLLSIWKVNLTPLLASAGVAGIALAMAAKDSLSNLFGGISMYADTAFKVGDYIVVDNDHRGEVMETGFRSTRIKTRDDIMLTIPNSVLSNAMIINESFPTKHTRLKIPVGVAYGTDLDKAEQIMLDQVEGVEGIIQRPEKRVRVRAFGDSSMDMELMVWIKDPSLRGLIKHELIKKVYNSFNEQGISIPFPQMDVHMKK